MSYRYSSRSTQRLSTCHPDLVLLFNEALADPACPSDISIIEGFRGRDRQNEMKTQGKSQLAWPKSRHNQVPSMAVDAAPYVGGISWDWDHYRPLSKQIKQVWKRLQAEGQVDPSHRLTWGGDWQSFPDGPHWQLDT